MGASPSGTRLGEPEAAKPETDAALVYVEVVNGCGLPLHRSHSEPEHCAEWLPPCLEADAHAILRFPIDDEVFISYITKAPDDSGSASSQRLSVYATLQNGGPLGLFCQLHLAASLTGQGLEELRPLAVRNGSLGGCSWTGRLQPRRSHLTLAEDRSEGRKTRQSFLDSLEAQHNTMGTVVEGYTSTGRAEGPSTAACSLTGSDDSAIPVLVKEEMVPIKSIEDSGPSPKRQAVQDASKSRKSRSGLVALEAQKALKAQREKLEREQRQEELEREMKANCSALIAMQDSEYHKSLLHDQLQDLREEQMSSEASKQDLEVELEKAKRQQDHATSRDNPRLREEVTAAQELQVTLQRQLDERSRRLVEVKELIAEKEELLCMAALAEAPEG